MHREKKSKIIIFIIFALTSYCQHPVFAQSTGTVTGTALLPDSSNPNGIFVTIIGQNKTAITDSSGNFSINAVNARPLRVQAGKLGYGNAVIDTSLLSGQILVLDLLLSSSIHDTESVIQTSSFTTSMANEGNIGSVNKFVDSNGIGFRWLGTQELREASLMIGTDTTHVSDAARFILGIAQNNLDHDFQSLSDIVVKTSGPDSVDCITSFDDSRSNFPPGIPSQPLGVNVTQESYLFPNSSDSGFMIVKLTITNTTSTALQNLLVGYFVDWDVQPTPNNNRGDILKVQNQISGVNNSQPFIAEIAEQRDATSGSRFMGVVPLSQPRFKAARIASVQQEIAPTGPNTGLTEANKYNYMRDRRAGNDTTDFGIEENLAMIVSVGGTNDTSFETSVFTLPAYSSITVGFGFVGGNDSLQFISNALKAQKKWVALGNPLNIITAVDGRPSFLPERFVLEQNYPNPFNPVTTISYHLSDARNFVTLKVYDVLGREVATLVNGIQSGGNKSIRFSAGTLTSGVYFYRLTAGKYSAVKKMLFLK